MAFPTARRHLSLRHPYVVADYTEFASATAPSTELRTGEAMGHPGRASSYVGQSNGVCMWQVARQQRRRRAKIRRDDVPPTAAADHAVDRPRCCLVIPPESTDSRQRLRSSSDNRRPADRSGAVEASSNLTAGRSDPPASTASRLWTVRSLRPLSPRQHPNGLANPLRHFGHGSFSVHQPIRRRAMSDASHRANA